MSFELPPEDIHELGTEEELDPQKILERPESVFVEKKLSPEQQKEALAFHDMIISNPELFVGRGNDGVVFDFPSEREGDEICLKNIWEEVSVEMKGKKFYLLPPKLQELRKIQEYFKKVKEKRREAISRGIDFVISNSPATEAGLQTAARLLLEAAGFEHAVPSIRSLIRIESKSKEDDEVDGVPFAYNEVADVIVMDKINGKSIQDFVIDYDKYQEILEKLDPEKFREELISMMEVIHDSNLTHQDVTKRNIMIDFDRLKPVIIDFGKASYGMGTFTKEQEMEHVDEVCRTLTGLKKDPERARQDLKRQLKVDF